MSEYCRRVNCFGTVGVRVSLFERREGHPCCEVANCLAQDHNFAPHSHAAQIDALMSAVYEALRSTDKDGIGISASAIYSIGSNVIPVGKDFQSLDDDYLWHHHLGWRRAEEITVAAYAQHLEAIEWSGAPALRSGGSPNDCIVPEIILQAIPFRYGS
jgi:ribulose kinase